MKAIAHITGGGFYDNIPRVVPEGLGIHINEKSWQVPELFWQVMERAEISRYEMFRTFNMGIGMVLVVSSKDADKTQKILKASSVTSYVIGIVTQGKGVTIE